MAEQQAEVKVKGVDVAGRELRKECGGAADVSEKPAS